MGCRKISEYAISAETLAVRANLLRLLLQTVYLSAAYRELKNGTLELENYKFLYSDLKFPLYSTEYEKNKFEEAVGNAYKDAKKQLESFGVKYTNDSTGEFMAEFFECNFITKEVIDAHKDEIKKLESLICEAEKLATMET